MKMKRWIKFENCLSWKLARNTNSIFLWLVCKDLIHLGEDFFSNQNKGSFEYMLFMMEINVVWFSESRTTSLKSGRFAREKKYKKVSFDFKMVKFFFTLVWHVFAFFSDVFFKHYIQIREIWATIITKSVGNYDINPEYYWPSQQNFKILKIAIESCKYL